MKIKSQIITEASGSIGGLTASHNRGGLYFRARTIPVNPNTPQQQLIRGFVAQLSNLWLDTLTLPQRTAWDTYALNVPLPDRLGEPRNVGGLAMYIRSNVPRLQASRVRIDDGPTIFNLGAYFPVTLASASVATQQLSVPYSALDDWVTEDSAAMIVWMARPQNTSVNYFKGPYRFAGFEAGSFGLPPVPPLLVNAPFPFVLGQKMFFRINVTRADGRLSSESRDFAVAVA